MHDELHDLRILHFALAAEDSLERLQAGLARHLQDPLCRAAAKQVQKPSPAHEELERAYEAMNERVESRPGGWTDQELLEGLLDGERLARAFYERWGPVLRDERLQQLFAKLAVEERGHAEAIGVQAARMESNASAR